MCRHGFPRTFHVFYTDIAARSYYELVYKELILYIFELLTLAILFLHFVRIDVVCFVNSGKKIIIMPAGITRSNKLTSGLMFLSFSPSLRLPRGLSMTASCSLKDLEVVNL